MNLTHNGSYNTGALANTLGVSSFGTGLIGIDIPGMSLIGSSPIVPEHPVDNTFNCVELGSSYVHA